MTRVLFSYVADHGSLDVDLPGHDAQAHCDTVLTAWLAHTAQEDDDAEDWEADEPIIFSDGTVVFRALPYRGEDCWFKFQAPEA